jgi:hypothetical protein
MSGVHEAEYIAADHCCAQLLWMRQTLRDYGYKLTKVPLLCDNESAIRMLCFQPELVLPDCSAGLLGQEGEVPADSASETDLLTDCSDGSGTDSEGTAFGTADAVEVDADSA